MLKKLFLLMALLISLQAVPNVSAGDHLPLPECFPCP